MDTRRRHLVSIPRGDRILCRMLKRCVSDRSYSVVN